MNNGESSEDEHPPPTVHKTPRPCDGCRTRKIKCDRKPPCSHCRAAGMLCRTSAQRPKEERSRVTISKQYESKIDAIDGRLANIERLLRQGNHGSSHSSPSMANAKDLDDVEADEDSPALIEIATTGRNRDALAARDVLEQTITSNSDSLSRDPQLNASLQSLRAIVSKLHQNSEDITSDLSRPDMMSSTPDLPPWEEMKELIELGRTSSPECWELYVGLVSLSEFLELCECIKRETIEGTIAQRTIMFSGLYCLCIEFSTVRASAKATYYHNVSLTYRRLAMTTIATLPLFAPATRNNITALSIAGIIAIDMAKPSLSWQLNSAALIMCQTLGYHRASVMERLSLFDQERNAFLFWNCYTMDRNTSLTLGRAPICQDYDITVNLPKPSSNISASLVHLLHFWVGISRVQGRICEKLYSPAGLRRSTEERTQLVQQCVQDLETTYATRNKVEHIILPPGEQGAHLASIEPIVAGDSIMYYATLTLALQAVAVTADAKALALDAARKCLTKSREVAQNYSGNRYLWAVCCHWLVLHYPIFTPFTVLFCSTIGDDPVASEDLELMRDLVRYLAPAREFSAGIEKFHQLCSVFCDIAAAYIHVKKQQSGQQNATAGTDGSKFSAQDNAQLENMTVANFDQYLSTLGLMAQPTANTDFSNGVWTNTDSLQDWYSANTSLYGLLDQDLDNFNDFLHDGSYVP